MYSSVLAALPKRPVSEILRDLDAVRTARKRAEDDEARVREKREQLQVEEATLVQLVALARLDEGGNRDQGVLPGAEDFSYDLLSSRHVDAIRNEDLRRALLDGSVNWFGNRGPENSIDIATNQALMQAKVKPRPFSKRPAILRVMQDHPEQELWTTRDIRRRLVEAGIEASINLVGVTMRRMERAGELVRDEDEPRFFKLAPDRETTSMGARGDSNP